MNHKISFSQQIKEEICSIEYSDAKNLAILASFIKTNGSLELSSNGSTLVLQSENAKIAKFIYSLVEKYCGVKPKLMYQQEVKLNKTTNFLVLIEDKIDEILDLLKIDFLKDTIDEKYFEDDQSFYGYIAGAFLCSGSCNSPTSSNYHCELSFVNAVYAIEIQHLINSYKQLAFNMRLIKRRNKYVIYLKKSDLISNFLIMIGAVSSCMEFENTRIDRDYSNVENRLMNLDGANFSKTYEANKILIENIKIIDSAVGLDHLDNDKLTLYCNLVLKNPEASMNEIAMMMGEQLECNISKGQVYHLSKKVKELAIKYGH